MVHKKKRKFLKTDPDSKQEENSKEIKSDPHLSKPQHQLRKRARIIVRNLPFEKLTEDKVRDVFKEFGELKEISLLRKPDGKLVGCGFVEFVNRRSAAKAIIQCNGKQMSGRPIIVDWAVPKSKFVKKVQQLQEETKVKTEDNKSDIVEYSIDKSPQNDTRPNNDSSNEENGDTDSEDDNENDDSFVKIEDEDQMNDTKPQLQQNKLNDVDEGKTIFIKNVPFHATSDDLKTCFSKYGDIIYALICIDKLTEHSKGTAFIKFKDKESASKSIKENMKVILFEQPLGITQAVSRDKLDEEKKKNKLKARDSRNLYLVREGVVMANSPAAKTVSAPDMAKRLQIEQWKTQILRNLNMFVSKTRLVVHNLPSNLDDAKLRDVFVKHSPVGAVIREARVMTDKKRVDEKGQPFSKEVGFVSFTEHDDALYALRQINNNPYIFTAARRPIVAFSIENREILNIKKKRLEKSRAKLAADKKILAKGKALEKLNRKQRRFLRRKEKIIRLRQEAKKLQREKGTESEPPKKSSSSKVEPPKKKRKIESKADMPMDYAGATAVPGKVTKLRSKSKLQQQAEMHKDVKRKLKMENMKKVMKSKNPERERAPATKKKSSLDNDMNFTNLVSTYKKQIENDVNAFKKWYET